GSFVPVATRVQLLATPREERVRVVWSSDLLQVSERTSSYIPIEELVSRITAGTIGVNSTPLGFHETEEANWSHRVVQNSSESEFGISAHGLALEGKTRFARSIDADSPPYKNAMMLNPEMPFSSIRELSGSLLGRQYEGLNEKYVEVWAPFNTRISSLTFYGSFVKVKAVSVDEIVPYIKFRAAFHLVSGEIHKHQPRFNRRSIQRTVLGNGLVQFEKAFGVPLDARHATGVSFTVSIGGASGIALDSKYCSNQPVANVIRSVLDTLDPTKTAKYFTTADFERTYASLGAGKDKTELEAVMCALLASCGLSVIWLGIFDLSCKDMLAFAPDASRILLVEVTTGAPTQKIGKMKTVLANLKSTAPWLEFVGLVATSNYVTDEDRNSARSSSVTLIDVTDLKALLQLSKEPPDPMKAMSLLGIS
ncbi:MAG: hypothetical protein ACE5IO_10545, partial [Thermoplasmata archaeon]